MALTIGAAYWVIVQLNRGGDPEQSMQEAEVAEDPQLNLRTPSSEAERTNTIASPSDPGFTWDSAQQVESMAATLSQAVPELIDMARGGDGQALDALNRLFLKCGVLYRGADDFTGTYASNSQPGTPAAVALDRLHRYCDFEILGMSHGDLARLIGEVQAAQLASGSPAARFRHFSMPDFGADGSSPSDRDQAVAEAWQAALTSDDPGVVAAALDLLLGSWDSPGQSVPELARVLREFDRDPGLAATGTDRRGEIRRLALQWYWCELGLPCRAYGPTQEVRCVQMGDCASHLELQEYIRQRLLTPSEYQALLRFVEALRRELRGG